MGYAFTELLPPAILLDHPGVTKEEFSDLLAQTYPSLAEFTPDDPWDIHLPERYYLSWNRLGDLANTLQLPFTNNFREFQKSKKDPHGLYLRPPQLYIGPDYWEDETRTTPLFQVTTHDKNVLGKKRIYKDTPNSHLGLAEIEYYENYRSKYVPLALVTKILEKIYVDNSSSISWTDSSGQRITRILPDHFYRYNIEATPITEVFTKHRYSSPEELYERWPQFNPEKMYDFSQPRGLFRIDFSDYFGWIQENGRYYLDPETFNKMPDSLFGTAKTRDSKGYTDKPYSDPGYGYTDLTLTAEAIRLKAWKLLSYRGLQHTQAFLEDFPEAATRQEKAIWDAHTSLAAKQSHLTHTEFLRMRLTGTF